MRIRSTTHADPGEEFVPAKPEGLNEQGRSRDHESSDEDDQTRKQHYVAQERTHTRLPLHLFCAGRLASAYAGRPAFSPLFFGLSFAETRARVRRMRMG